MLEITFNVKHILSVLDKICLTEFGYHWAKKIPS